MRSLRIVMVSGARRRGMAGFLPVLLVLFCVLLFPSPSLSAPENGGGKASGDPLAFCVQLKWFHQSQFAGFYLAEQRGLYERAGLLPEFLEGGPEVDWQETIEEGPCPIGVTNAYEVVVARARGLKVKAVAALDQVSPIVWFTLEESGIRDPRRFRNKSMALVPTGRVHLIGMLKKVDVPLESIDIRPFSVDMSRLFEGEVDIWSGYHTNLVTRAEQQGYDLNIIHPYDYGVQIYDDVIYVREGFERDHPRAVEEFLRATLRGWSLAFRNPEAAVHATLAKQGGSGDWDIQMGLLRRTISYVHTGEVPIGWMERGIWAEISELTREAGLVEETPEAEEIYDPSYLKKIYGEGLR